jgi:XTP/dITP diphosphohydrolase
MKIVLATRNSGKVREMTARLSPLGVEVVSSADFPSVQDIVEDAESLEGNALKKARAVYKATGLPALADDTGLEVTALGGRPGVRSARYAGEDASDESNRKRLLEQMVNAGDRAARFRTVLAFVVNDGEHVFEGICDGRICEEERGEQGFGYDPVFLPEDSSRTFAEMDVAEKNAISHRGRALEAFEEYLKSRIDR